MSVSWRYRLQVVTLSIWRRLPGWLRVAVSRLAGVVSRPPQASGVRIEVADGLGRRPTVICLPIIDWGMRVQRPQHLLGGLARRGWSVLYVGKDFARGSSGRIAALAPGVVSLTLPGRSGASIYHGTPTSADVECWLATFERLQGGAVAERAVVIVQWPYWTPLAMALRDRWQWPVIYDCLDEHSAHPAADSAVVGLEAGLVADADFVTVSSRALLTRCAALTSRCELVPNACEFEHFHGAPQPARERLLEGPVIGYYGALAEWFAPELVEQAALYNPTWQFVLIGLNSGADLARIARLPNVHLLGELRYAELPRWLHRFDVATIPFRLTPLTLATNPVKLFEYFAVGKPVVATALPEIEPYGHLCYLVANPGDFAGQIEAALAERDPGRVAARVEAARANTWDARVDRLETLLLEVLVGRGGSDRGVKSSG